MTPTTKTWRFEAHQVREIPSGPDQVVAALEMAPLLQVESVHHGRVRVRTGGMVGAMVRGTLRVEVRPRHMSRAVTLGLVLGSGCLDAHILPADHAPDDDLLRLVALAFLGAVGRLFQRGLRPDRPVARRSGPGTLARPQEPGRRDAPLVPRAGADGGPSRTPNAPRCAATAVPVGGT